MRANANNPKTPEHRPVLLVSSDPNATAMDLRNLDAAGFQDVEVAQGGAEAIRTLKTRDHWFALCGDPLADISATGFLDLTRQTPELAALPVILVSRNSSRAAVLDAIAAGCSGYLIRPYSLVSFAKQVERAVRLAAVSLGADLKLPARGLHQEDQPIRSVSA